MSEGSAFDMNALLRGEVQQDAEARRGRGKAGNG